MKAKEESMSDVNLKRKSNPKQHLAYTNLLPADCMKHAFWQGDELVPCDWRGLCPPRANCPHSSWQKGRCPHTLYFMSKPSLLKKSVTIGSRTWVYETSWDEKCSEWKLQWRWMHILAKAMPTCSLTQETCQHNRKHWKVAVWAVRCGLVQCCWPYKLKLEDEQSRFMDSDIIFRYN